MARSPSLELVASSRLGIVGRLLRLLSAVLVLDLLGGRILRYFNFILIELLPEVVEFSGVLFKVEWMVDNKKVLLIV